MNNQDPKEIKKFDDMAVHWWDIEGPCKPLHLLNPIRLGFIQSQCHLHDQSLIDVGCGGGILTEALSQFSPHVVGIDLAQEAINVAQAHAKHLQRPPQYVLSSAETYAESHPQAFSVVTCMELIERVPNPVSLLTALATLLKPQGDLFISTLNRTPKAFLQAIIGAEYILRILPIGTHDYRRFIRPSEIAEWIKSLDLTIQSIRGIQYHVFSQRFSLSHNIDVNYIMHLRKNA